MAAMSADQVRDFLTGAPRTAKLACVRGDGSAHVAPVWFLLDGDDVIVTTSRSSVKGAAVLRDPRVSLCVDDERPPFAFAVVRGVAHVSEDPDEVHEWAGRLAARYLGDDGSRPGFHAEMAERNSGPGEMVVRVTPTHMVGESAVTG